MPFGLKNAGSTYKRMITKIFEPQLGKSIEVYIDDMVVKSKVTSKHVGDLRVILDILRKHKLRLNAFKCSFGIGSGKFLGYMVTHRGLEVSPVHIKANSQSATSSEPQRSPETHWNDRYLKSIYLQICRQVPTFLPPDEQMERI